MSATQLLRISLLFFSGIIIHSNNSQAQSKLNIATTPVPFLRITPDARSGGMGDAGIAVQPDAGAAYHNAGKLVFNQDAGGATLSYIPWLRKISNDVYFVYAAGYYKPDEHQALGIGVRYFSLGDIRFTSDGHDNLGSGRPREMSVDLTYSRKLSEKLGLGISARYIHSSLVQNISVSGYNYQRASAIAADLGLYYDGRTDGDGFIAGIALSNLGSKIAYIKNTSEKDFLPANLGIGASWNKLFNEVHSFSLAVDMNKLLVPVLKGDSPDQIAAYRRKNVVTSWGDSFADFPGQLGVSAGMEYWYDQLFAVRAGYSWESDTRGNRKYFTTGVGARYQAFGFNFSYLIPSGTSVNQNPLSNTLRFSLMLYLNNNE